MPELAINGGNQVAQGGLKPIWPIFGEEEGRQLSEVLRSGRWCSLGNESGKNAQFEKEFAKYIGTKYAMAVPSGTAALEVAFRACGIGNGDEVIVPSLTFVASASAVSLTGAKPVFVDIEPETYQISPDGIEEAITERTKAIEPVHYGGYPADMDKILQIAEKHSLRVIEDACEAHGSEWRGKRAGSLGDIGCFSFQMGKPLTGGEGGGITFNDEALRFRCYQHVHLGRTPGGGTYEHNVPAGNYRMSEFVAAILLAQLGRLPEQTETRHKNGEYLAQELEDIGGIHALKRDPRITKRGYYFYLMRYNSLEWDGIPRDRFMEALQAEGIVCGTAHTKPLYTLPAYKDSHPNVHCPVAERVYREEVVSLGKNFLMERANVDTVIKAITKLRKNIGELVVK